MTKKEWIFPIACFTIFGGLCLCAIYNTIECVWMYLNG